MTEHRLAGPTKASQSGHGDRLSLQGMVFKAQDQSSSQLQALVAAAMEGDGAARDELARCVLPRVRRTVAMAYGGGPERDDLVQIAMARAFERLGSYRGEAGFHFWIDRVTANVIKDFYRSRRWTWLPLFEADSVPADPLAAPWPDREVETNELMERLDVHLGRMKPNQRMAVVLHLLHGYTSSEVAVLLDVKFDAARKRILRGRKELMRRLKRDPRCREMLLRRGE